MIYLDLSLIDSCISLSLAGGMYAPPEMFGINTNEISITSKKNQFKYERIGNNKQID